MIKTEVEIDGIMYTIRTTSAAGIENAIRALEMAVKQNEKYDEDNA